MNASPELNIDAFFDNIILSYETRIHNIQTAFQSSENISASSLTLFDCVHHSLFNLKQERDVISARLCESLAKNGSLRKKDYHHMMSGILDILNKKEAEAEIAFLSFIENQKGTAQSLRNSLLEIKEIASPEATEKITSLKAQLSAIAVLQETRKENVMNTFLHFQQLHIRMMDCLENLLKKGDHIQVQDVKKAKEQISKEIN
jgi:hypothetical protein